MLVCEGSEEEASKGSGEEVPTSSTSHPVSMTVVGSFCWGSEAGTAVGEAWGQEPDEEDGVEDEDTFMARCRTQKWLDHYLTRILACGKHFRLD